MASDPKAAAKAAAEYKSKTKTDTVSDVVGADELRDEWLKEGQWRPAWSQVEFDHDACVKNVTAQGQKADGFYAPAGTILPLGAAFPKMTSLQYGGYFPAGTAFPGGVMVPLHARMVNILPEETKKETVAASAESWCVIM